jgi:hypothetical protein
MIITMLCPLVTFRGQYCVIDSADCEHWKEASSRTIRTRRKCKPWRAIIDLVAIFSVSTYRVN